MQMLLADALYSISKSNYRPYFSAYVNLHDLGDNSHGCPSLLLYILPLIKHHFIYVYP